MNEIKVLFVGSEGFEEFGLLPYYVTLIPWEELTKLPNEPYDLAFFLRIPEEEELLPLYACTKTYGVFVQEELVPEGEFAEFCKRKKAKTIKTDGVSLFLQKEARFFYPKPYGEKYKLNNLSINRDFQGTIVWNGNSNVTLSGEFGKEFRQIAYFRNYIPIEEGQTLEFWLEYKKGPGVSLEMEIIKNISGSVDFIERKWTYTEKDMENVIHLENVTGRGLLMISFRAKGLGTLQFVALHDRHSRGSHGHFLPGGERYVTSKREEIFCYFDPGDLKPPLNVYFSGYKTQEGFEGYNIMKRMGAPFLLVSEARLEGGAFYMGSEEYEELFSRIIRDKMEELGFTEEQVVFAGLSMGTYGALYYGCEIRPHAILLGKPLANIGDVAVNERLNRPGGFPTSLDVLAYHCEEATEAKAEELNDRFWERFSAADFSKTKFIISYMVEDDYDMTAYERILSHLDSDGVQVYGKGLHGRHNDNTGGVVQWFLNRYMAVLQEDFHRKLGD